MDWSTAVVPVSAPPQRPALSPDEERTGHNGLPVAMPDVHGVPVGQLCSFRPGRRDVGAASAGIADLAGRGYGTGKRGDHRTALRPIARITAGAARDLFMRKRPHRAATTCPLDGREPSFRQSSSTSFSPSLLPPFKFPVPVQKFPVNPIQIPCSDSARNRPWCG
jgi:hypothetical protein